MRARSILAALAGVAALGAATTQPPQRLTETGLYAGRGTAVVDARNRPFSPQYPLWTDGAVKSRWIFIPDGTTIDTTDPFRWSFPVGTKLWKEFAFGGKKVETRLVWKTGQDAWLFASYVWNDEQSEAYLAPEEGVPNVAEVAPGRFHSIPARTDCVACHRGGKGESLGFDALQLSDDRDPAAPHAEPLRPGMVTLRSLVDEGRLVPDRREWVEHPPRIEAATPRERAALGYLAANCGACHNSHGPLARLGLVLAHEPGSAVFRSTVDVAGIYAVPGIAPERSRRIAPGAPENSALLHRMKSRRPMSQMPPLGTVVADAEAIELIRGWIADDLPASGAAR
ncbi:MAG TPA: hypothetical protein VF139_13645 [Candidatus Polarisedimenticolaceae bacterium]